MIHNIPQPAFEQYVTDVLAKDSNVDIRRGVSFISLRQVSDSLCRERLLILSLAKLDPQAVIATVEERTTGHQFQIRSKYLIACDGARSKVRANLGIDSDGEDSCEVAIDLTRVLPRLAG